MVKGKAVALFASSTEQQRAEVKRLIWSCALLAIVIAVAALIVAGIVHRGISNEALSSAVIAGAVCWVAAALALIATYVGNRLNVPVHGMLVSMIFRLGLPLAALVIFRNQGAAFSVSGATFTLLGVYLVALATETTLALRMTAARIDAPIAKA